MKHYRTYITAAGVCLITVGAFIVKIASKDGQSAVRPVANAAPLAAAPAAAQPIVDTASKTSAGESFLAAISVQPAGAPAQPVDMPVFYETGWQSYDDYTWTGSPDNVVGQSSTSGSTVYFSAEGSTSGSTSSASSASSGISAGSVDSSGISGAASGSSGGSAGGSSSGSADSSSSGSADSSSSGSGDSSSSDTSQTAGDSSADTSSSGSTTTSGSGGAVNPFSNIYVTVISSMERLLQDDISAPGTASAEVFCAKNETESFQIIVTNKSYQTLPDIELYVSDWQGPSSSKKPKITLFREHYVVIYKPSPRSASQPGWYPDALIPFVDPYTGDPITTGLYRANHQSIAPRKNQGYWIDVRVDSDVPAGTYTASILVTSSSRPVAEIPVTLKVWNFELPNQHALKTFFTKLVDVSYYHSCSKDSSLYRIIEERYIRLLDEHGIKLRFSSVGYWPDSTGKIIFSQAFREGIKSFTEQYKPFITIIAMEFSKEPDKAKEYLKSWESFVCANPWLPCPVIYCPELVTEEDYLNAKNYGLAIKQFAPHIKYWVTEQIAPSNPDWPSLEGVVDIWCPTWWLASVDDIRRRQSAGDEVWSYTHGDNYQGAPSWLIEFPLLHYRIPSWFSYSLDLKGLHYWNVVSWCKTDEKIDPWINVSTYERANYSSGEGFLLYPGSAAGIAGPVASMRLKVLRDGLEDYDYFQILAGLSTRREAETIVGDVASTFTRYSKDAQLYINTRTMIAERIINNLK